MRRNILGWGLVIIVVVGFLVLLGVGKKPEESFSELVVSKDKWYELMSARERTNEGMVERVRLNGEELMTAGSGTRWYYSVVEGQANAKDPKVDYRTGVGAKLAILESGITDEMIREGEGVKVMAYTGEKYEIYELFVTTLPLLSIDHTGMRDMAKSDSEETMWLKLFDNRAEAKQRLTMTEGKIKVRGAMAAMFPKKGFRMQLRMMSVGENKRVNDLSLLGMRQDDDWLLYAGYNDQEKVRNVFAMNLWKEGQAGENEFNLDNGVEYKYVELIMNDEYYGLYALGYPIDELVLGLRKGQDGYFEEFSFKKSDWTAVAGALGGYELKTDVKNTQLAWSELQDYVEVISDGTADEVRGRTDMRTLINVHLFAELTQSADTFSWGGNDMKNLYLTAKEWGTGYKWLYTPWDMDLAFGNYWKDDMKNITAEYFVEPTDESELVGSPVTRLIKMGDGKVADELRRQYEKLREGVWSDDHINELIDEYEMEIYRSGAFRRDADRWPEGNYNDPDEELVSFREYVLNRLQYMDGKYL